MIRIKILWHQKVAFVCLLILLGSLIGRAQVTTGVITGTARDATAAALPGVSVTVTEVGTGFSRSAVTDERGDYSFPALPPGIYNLKAELAGFKKASVEKVDLKVNEKLTVNFSLQVGELAEQVTVEAAALNIEAQSASLSQVIDQRKITELPLNTRSYIQLAALAAGVSPKAPLRTTQFGDRNQYVNIDGGRDSSTNYLMDGVETRSLRFNNSSLQPPIDMIREFKVERNSFSSEFGHGNSVITVVTKSGTNELHGTVYEFFRNDKLDARNFFDATKPAFRRNQFGAAAGAPIIRNKTFLFGGYEGLRSSKGFTLLATVPDPRLLTGDFSSLATPIRDPLNSGQPFPGNRIPDVRIARFSRLWRDQIPAPNRAGTSLNFLKTATFLDNYDQFNIRVDHKFSDDSTMFVRYTYSTWDQFDPTNATTFGRNFPQDGQNVTAQHTYVFSPSLLNEFKLGYNRAVHFILQANPGGRNWVADLGLRNLAGATDPLNFGRPSVAITGFSTVGETTITQGAIENIYSMADNLTKIWGKHTTKFGVDIQHRRYHHVTEVPPRGSFTFTGFATGNPIGDFLLGFPFQAQSALGSSRSNYRSNYFAFFVQDDFKATRNLTLNLGLRYENATPWVEQDFQEGVFAPDLGLIVYPKIPANMPPALQGLFFSRPGVRRGIINHDWKNFAPRLGLAYRPFNNEDTVIRAGFGIFYDNINGNEFQFTRLIPPFYGINTLISDARTPTLFIDNLFPTIDQLDRLPAPFSIIRTDGTPYTMQWNLNLQRKAGRDLLFEVSYAGSGGRKLWKRFNMNQADLDPTGTIPLGNRLPFPRFDPGILTSGRDSNSTYNAVSIRVEKSYAQGFSILANYTFSRAIDLNSGEIEANDTARRWDKRADRGLARHHQKHRFVCSYLYELPIGRGKRFLNNTGGLAGYLVGGWQVNGITTFSTGFPFTLSAASVHGTGSFVPQRANRVGDGTLPRDQRTVERYFDITSFRQPAAGTQGNAGRNIVIGPGVNNWDLSIIKNNRLTEQLALQFRAEFFNVFNHPQFTTPSSDVSSRAFGRIDRAADARDIQFGLKLVW